MGDRQARGGPVDPGESCEAMVSLQRELEAAQDEKQVLNDSNTPTARSPSAHSGGATESLATSSSASESGAAPTRRDLVT